jgi:hypothetical protein
VAAVGSAAGGRSAQPPPSVSAAAPQPTRQTTRTVRIRRSTGPRLRDTATRSPLRRTRRQRRARARRRRTGSPAAASARQARPGTLHRPEPAAPPAPVSTPPDGVVVTCSVTRSGASRRRSRRRTASRCGTPRPACSPERCRPRRTPRGVTRRGRSEPVRREHPVHRRQARRVLRWTEAERHRPADPHRMASGHHRRADRDRAIRVGARRHGRPSTNADTASPSIPSFVTGMPLSAAWGLRTRAPPSRCSNRPSGCPARPAGRRPPVFSCHHRARVRQGHRPARPADRRPTAGEPAQVSRRGSGNPRLV